MNGDDYIGRSEFRPYYARLKDGRLVELDLPADADGAAAERFLKCVYENNREIDKERQIEFQKLRTILDNM